MKRSEMLMHMQRAYGIRHVMVENGHITLEEFMDELLTHMESKGITPPDVCREEDPKKFYNSTKHAAHFHMGKDLHYWEKEDDDDDHPRSGAV